jgi:hypothetical protein
MEFEGKQTSNIWGAFHGAGFEFDVDVEPYQIRFHAEKLRQNPGFQEIWALDFPIEKLSPRRQAVRFGWINKPE